ncbi:MAG: TatD family hydrolase [Acidobacteria bacterium]|nr:TatD family hydrolase [Acidobacteriota bacterium]
MKLIDIGINLTHRSFESDRELVLKRAQEAGVTTLILTGTSVKGSREALRLVQHHPHILFSTAGVHPHDARHCTEETIETLRKMAESPEVVAIGECGLDYNRDFSPRPDQNRWFEAQIQLASEVKKPLFLHERDAHAAFVHILKPYRDQFTAGVVHCFTGTEAELKAYLDLDLHIGITGWICDERRGQHLQKLVKLVPLNRSEGSGFRVPGSGFRVPGSGFRVPGSGFRVPGSGFSNVSLFCPFCPFCPFHLFRCFP